MSSQKHADKSTNVRFNPWRQRALRGGIAALGQLSPDLAAAWAERMFLSPQRLARPEWEEALLSSARRGSFAYGRAQLPSYTWGEGSERVLLLHGWEGRGSQLGGFVPKLVSSGFQAVAVDLPGHGDASPARTSVVDFAHAVTALLDQLGTVSGVIAHSMGAAATALAHTFRPFDASLVLIGAPRSPRSFFDGFAQHVSLSANAKRALETRIERRFGLGIDAIDVVLRAPSIPLPALVVHDRADPMVPFEHALALSAALPAATLLATEGLGHRRILRDPQVIDAALGFIERTRLRSELATQAA